MDEHIKKNVRIDETEVAKRNTDVTERSARVGAEIGTKTLPVIGTAVGGLIGTAYGTGLTLATTTIYVWKTLTGRK